ncbi:inner membrane-spanning protein YciB [Pseudoalteromonas spongiae]|uniref:inner membrane-spanning protein YciB n=1 Tax=Pseudoalteromonas spongiae TaxID=298657 RepID=UPI00110A341A|nr:inner membrane-spanning protein YciB [Pseudoalteromonas spongiae]TMO88748.1 intracellular septation protein A [Pseudoalteromonas spongiae]
MLALFEYAPLILFFILYKTMDIFWATSVLIGASVLQIAYYFFIEKKVATKHWVLFALAVGLGSLTILFQDEQFIKWKATVVYAGFATILLASRYFFNKNLMAKMLGSILASTNDTGQKIEVPKPLWDKINLFWSAFLYLIAAVNIYVAYAFSLDFWVNFKVFGITAATFIALIVTIAMLYQYLPDDEEQKSE